jgi:hypothetical protein
LYAPQIHTPWCYCTLLMPFRGRGEKVACRILHNLKVACRLGSSSLLVRDEPKSWTRFGSQKLVLSKSKSEQIWYSAMPTWQFPGGCTINFEAWWLLSSEGCELADLSGKTATAPYSNIFEYASAISYHIHILFAPSTAYHIHMYLNMFKIYFSISYLWPPLLQISGCWPWLWHWHLHDFTPHNFVWDLSLLSLPEMLKSRDYQTIRIVYLPSTLSRPLSTPIRGINKVITNTSDAIYIMTTPNSLFKVLSQIEVIWKNAHIWCPLGHLWVHSIKILA